MLHKPPTICTIKSDNLLLLLRDRLAIEALLGDLALHMARHRLPSRLLGKVSYLAILHYLLY